MNLRKLRKYRRIFYLLFGITILTVAIAMKSRYNNTICSDIIVSVKDSAVQQFVTRSTIIDYLTQNIGYNIKGNKFKNIDIDEIEKIIEKIPFIKNAEVYRTRDDVIAISVTQRSAIARIFDQNGSSLYIDNEGFILPLSDNFTAYVPVFNGKIEHIDSIIGLNVNDSLLLNSVYHDVFVIAKQIHNDRFIDNLIDQVYLNNNDFELIPKVGDFVIVIGDTSRIKQKFDNLKVFYKNVPQKFGWDIYTKVNLKYSNQIVCTKKSN